MRAGDENAMMQAVAQQPVAVAIDGDDTVCLGAFQGPMVASNNKVDRIVLLRVYLQWDG